MAVKSENQVRLCLWWAVLALPAVWLVFERIRHAPIEVVNVSGDIAAWFLIVTLSITPLMFLVGPLPWLRAHRRHLGVASFLYAVLHLVLWLGEVPLRKFVYSIFRLEMLVGWIAFAIMIALAVTSTDSAVARMGTGWKRLQRWAYAAAILTFLHWVLTSPPELAFVSFAPLFLLSIWRIVRARMRGRQSD